MGYTTKFSGHIDLSRRLTMLEAKQLLTFADDPDNIEGPHPQSYLQWVPSQTMDAIVWDGQEKFYDYEQWLQWVIDWLASSGVLATGELVWQGEQTGDIGVLRVLDGKVHVVKGQQANRTVHKPLTLKRLGEIALEQVTS